MKSDIERRPASGIKDYFALAVTTFGVGYLPLAPGTWGSAVGVLIYLWVGKVFIFFSDRVSSLDPNFEFYNALTPVILSLALLLFCLAGVWAAGRSTQLLGNADPPQAVVDEVLGQLVTFLFIPFTVSWKLILAGFLLFRLFDIWKPYPIRYFEILPGGLGICADDIAAGIYAGICLSVVYAVSLSL